MTKDAVGSLRINMDELSNVLASLSEGEWQAASSCAGCRVQDVVAHMNSSGKMMTGKQAPPPRFWPPQS